MAGNSFAILDEMNALDEAQEDAREQYGDSSDVRNDPKFLARCASHMILVMDLSSSMRTEDASTSKDKAGEVVCIRRIDALLRGFQAIVAQQMASGVGEFDFLTLIRMQDDADFIAQMEPFASAAARMPAKLHPRSVGNYIPALLAVKQAIEELEAKRSEYPDSAVAEMHTHVLLPLLSARCADCL